MPRTKNIKRPGLPFLSVLRAFYILGIFYSILYKSSVVALKMPIPFILFIILTNN